MRRRALKALVAAAMCGTILSVPGRATAQPYLVVDGDHGRQQWRVASATWSRPKGDERIFHTLSVEEIQQGWPDGRPRYFPYLYVSTCEVNAMGEARGGCMTRYEYDARVVSFEMDPALMSTRVVLRLEGRRADVTWTGGSPVLTRPVDVHANQSLDPPEYVSGGADAEVMVARDASAEGSVFGESFGDADLDEAWVYHLVDAESSVYASLSLDRSSP